MVKKRSLDVLDEEFVHLFTPSARLPSRILWAFLWNYGLVYGNQDCPCLEEQIWNPSLLSNPSLISFDRKQSQNPAIAQRSEKKRSPGTFFTSHAFVSSEVKAALLSPISRFFFGKEYSQNLRNGASHLSVKRRHKTGSSCHRQWFVKNPKIQIPEFQLQWRWKMEKKNIFNYYGILWNIMESGPPDSNFSPVHLVPPGA